MDEKTLTRLLRAEGTEADQPERGCPDEALLSAYVEHRVLGQKREQLESHLADCEACLGQVAFLARQPEEAAAVVQPGAVARARDLVAPAPSFWRPVVLRWAAAAAGVACVAVAAALVLRSPSGAVVSDASPVSDGASAVPAPGARDGGNVAPEAGSRKPDAGSLKPDAGSLKPEAGSRKPEAGPAAPRSAPPSRSVRNSADLAPALSVLSPTEAATVDQKGLEFRWKAIPGSLYYEISVVTDDGAVVWHARVEGTSAHLPDGPKLETGAKYFVWVKAFLSGGETVRSAAVSFHIAGQ